MDRLKQIDWFAWIATFTLIISFREGSLLMMQQFNRPELGNLVGLISLLTLLMLLKKMNRLPDRLIHTSNIMMKESSFAFLPICAGSLMMLVQMGKTMPLFLFVLVFSTLLPLWAYAHLAKRWL